MQSLGYRSTPIHLTSSVRIFRLGLEDTDALRGSSLRQDFDRIAVRLCARSAGICMRSICPRGTSPSADWRSASSPASASRPRPARAAP